MIFDFLRSSSKVGIDIGNSSIKVVELSKHSGHFKLDNYGVFELKMNGPGGNDISNVLGLSDEQITDALKQTLAQAKITSKNAVASVASVSTFATVIELPFLSEEELAKAIPFEARKYIPIPLDEVVLDWSIIGVSDRAPSPVPGAPTATVEVFLAAVPKDDTARYQRIVQAAGLKLVALELENAALVRALLGNDLSPTTLVNIGGRSTSIVVVSKGYERLSHNYEIGGFEVTRAIARSLGVNLEKAEELKRKHGLTDTPDNAVKDAINSLVDMIVFETKKTITGYEESKNTPIGRVVLVGGLANMPNFVPYFQERLGRPVVLGNSLARVIYPQQLAPILPELSNIFSVAVGLGMRQV